MNALLLQEVLDHLTAERAAILRGDFPALDKLRVAKVALVDRLAQSSGMTAFDLGQVGAGVARNQRLLTAAMAGVRQAGARLSAVTDARDTLRTYDQRGQTRDVAQLRPNFERKA
jgi:hypothetical protein